MGRFKPRQGTISPPPERRGAPDYHGALGSSGGATSLKVSL